MSQSGGVYDLEFAACGAGSDSEKQLMSGFFAQTPVRGAPRPIVSTNTLEPSAIASLICFDPLGDDAFEPPEEPDPQALSVRAPTRLPANTAVRTPPTFAISSLSRHR